MVFVGLDMIMFGDGLGWVDGKLFWGLELFRVVLNGSVFLEWLNDMVICIVVVWY